MPSLLPQFNVRITAEAIADVEAIILTMRETLNMPVSQSDFMYAAIAEMKKRYPPAQPAKAPKPTRKPRQKPKEKS